MIELTEDEREALVCDCVMTEDDEHGEVCATRGEYDVLISPAVIFERVEAIIAARLAKVEALATGWARQQAQALAADDPCPDGDCDACTMLDNLSQLLAAAVL